MRPPNEEFVKCVGSLRSNPRWHDFKRCLAQDLAECKDKLVLAPVEFVSPLQGEARCLKELLENIERSELAGRAEQ
jgi:hypothetical protein